MNIKGYLFVQHLLTITLFIAATAAHADLKTVEYAQNSEPSENMHLAASSNVENVEDVENGKTAKSDKTGRFIDLNFIREKLTFRQLKKIIMKGLAIDNSPKNTKNESIHEKSNMAPDAQLASVSQAKDTLVDNPQNHSRKIRNEYSKTLYVHASKNIQYPQRSKALNQTGKVLAQVTIDRKGNLLDVELAHKSDHAYLNRAVQRALKKSQPYPDVPQDIGGDTFSFEVPVAFEL